MTNQQLSADDLLARGRWADARTAFRALLDEQETAAHWSGLAQASRALDDLTTARTADETAYRLYLDVGDAPGAAEAALRLADLAVTYSGDGAVAAGWLGRARQHLRGTDHPLLPEVIGMQSYLALAYDKNPAAARTMAEEALTAAVALGDPRAQFAARGHLGLVLVCLGEVGAGMRVLDEVTAAAAAGEMAQAEALNTYCLLITACERVRDFARVTQWARTVMRAAADAGDEGFSTFAEIEYAHVLARTGRWREAEEKLRRLTAQPEERPLTAAMAYVYLADLHLRRGDLTDADEALRFVEREPWRRSVRHLVIAGRVGIQVATGQHREAADLARRYLRIVDPSATAERVEVLEHLVRATLALGEIDTPDGTREAVRELAAAAATIGTDGVRAAAALASARLAAADGEFHAALEGMQTALDLYDAAGMVPDVVQVEVETAEVYQRAGDHARASEAATRAAEHAHEVGMPGAAATAAGLLTTLTSGTGGRPANVAGLTDREAEVLRWVARGETNAEIAARLVLSVRTVERHLSNIYLKLDVSGSAARAIATNLAHRHGLA